MALINCQECAKQISSEASICPNCGFKLKKSSGSLRILGYFILAIVGLMLLGKCASEVNSLSKTHIGGKKELPHTGTFSCINPKVVHYAKSPSGTINDTVKSVTAKIQFTETDLTLDVKVNGFNQSYKPMQYIIEGDEIIANAQLKEDKRLDPTTNRHWISSTTQQVRFNLKTMELKRVVRNESLALDRKVTGFETFTLTAKCPI
jgi:hypothetical protein